MDDIKLSRKDSGNNSPIRKEGRAKAKSVFLVCKKYSFDQLSTLLEFNVQLSPTLQKKMNSQSLSSYTNRLVNQIYGSDMLGIGKVTIQFLEKDYSKHRQRVHQRISLLKYQAQTLKFKSFIDVQRQIVKQWRKNVLFASLNTIWITKMLTFKFSHLKQFSESYKKQVALISNLTHFYFKEALVILDAGKIATFNNLQEETAHKILNQLQDWEELYNGSLLPLIKLNNEKQKLYMDMNYETKILNINPNYLDLQSGEIALLQTAQKIRQFANKCTIHGKIQALKQMRSTFLRQIQQSRVLIAEKRSFQQFSTLEKDDVIGCMIYCIVAWKIDSIQASIQSLYELLGPNNQLLSRKGVDSYRADLQSAVQYLCQQGAAYSKQNSKHLEQKQSEIELAYKSTHLDLFGSI